MAITRMTALIKCNDQRGRRNTFDRWTISDKKSKGIKVKTVSEEVLIKTRKKTQKTTTSC